MTVLLLTSCVVGEGETTWGTVVVHAADQAGAPVANVDLSVNFKDPPPPNVLRTAEDGQAEIIGEEGTWWVAILPPEGYAVAEGQSNPFQIRIRRSETAEAIIHLTGPGARP